MTVKEKTQSTTEQQNAAKGSVTVELSNEALKNLTGYLDILIQMDLAQKQINERGKNVTNLQNTTSHNTKVN